MGGGHQRAWPAWEAQGGGGGIPGTEHGWKSIGLGGCTRSERLVQSGTGRHRMHNPGPCVALNRAECSGWMIGHGAAAPGGGPDMSWDGVDLAAMTGNGVDVDFSKTQIHVRADCEYLLRLPNVTLCARWSKITDSMRGYLQIASTPIMYAPLVSTRGSCVGGGVAAVGVEAPNVTAGWHYAIVPSPPPSRAALQGETSTRACRMGRHTLLRA
jgi:hypothetical protein